MKRVHDGWMLILGSVIIAASAAALGPPTCLAESLGLACNAVPQPRDGQCPIYRISDGDCYNTVADDAGYSTRTTYQVQCQYQKQKKDDQGVCRPDGQIFGYTASCARATGIICPEPH